MTNPIAMVNAKGDKTRHVGHTGAPAPCNAYCDPDQRIHAEVLYGGPIPAGTLCSTRPTSSMLST